MARLWILAILFMFATPWVALAEGSEAGTSPMRAVTIRAARDMGYFAGDLVKANIELVVEDSYELEAASLPHPGPIAYWLDLRSIDVTRRSGSGGTHRVNLAITYQNFYDALDTRPQEIPTFQISFKKGTEIRTAFVPAWTIGVSALREVAPPVKEDPREYMRADEPAPLMKTDPLWIGSAVAMGAGGFAILLLLFDRGMWPFHARPARAFGDVSRDMRRLASQRDTDERYLAALLLIHRGIDRTDGRRVLADDLSAFLGRHPVFSAATEGLTNFFAASRYAFFASDPLRSRATMPFRAVERLAQKLASAELTR